MTLRELERYQEYRNRGRYTSGRSRALRYKSTSKESVNSDLPTPASAVTGITEHEHWHGTKPYYPLNK